MITFELFTGFVAGGLLVLAIEAATGWAKRKTKPAVVVPPPPQYDPKDVAFNRGSRWYSLPGGRLELGDTGFYITLNPGEPDKVYQGFNPEGHCIVFGNDLASMKRLLDGEAAERAEFSPPAWGWRR